ncbi:MAG TPA: PEP/pyruvate-binding domain-containing protein [Acidimicrobiia bacterium]|nr:PEP/pyruvate-binding domain-containing protein [Acidimicrobiia bacterium]
MRGVVSLDETVCLQVEVSGGKGASLGRMRAAGMPVPPGFVVTADAMRQSLAESGHLEEVESLVAVFANDGSETHVRAIQDLVMASAPGSDLTEEINQAYKDLGNEVFVAVRSSACAEDSDSASFAGQQETFLNVIGADSVLHRIVECWASFFAERALFYRKAKGSLADLGMAVVVQKQLTADKSGVLFTTDPIRQRRDQMVIEAAYGLGEAVVSGMVTPDNYVARRDGRLKKAHVGRQDSMIIRNGEGGTITVEVDEEMAVARVLDDDEIAQLVAVGLELESAFGAPQDIEWAFEDGGLFVLQSRPITT